MIKAIFFDVDGTLVSFRTHVISPTTLRALSYLREHGVSLFLSTGRHYLMLDGLRRQFEFDGYLTLSGQYCFCGDHILRKVPMDHDSVAELVSAAQEAPFSCIFLEARSIYVNLETEATRQFIRDLSLDMPPLASPQRALQGEIYQTVTFLDEEHEHLLFSRAPQLAHTRWHPNFLDVIPPGGGKDKGVDAAITHLGLRREEAMAFGDGENDLSMLRYAGVGVAMGTASDTVKAGADYVTDSVDDEGVVTALIHYGLLPPDFLQNS